MQLVGEEIGDVLRTALKPSSVDIGQHGLQKGQRTWSNLLGTLGEHW